MRAVVCMVIISPCGIYAKAGRTIGKHDCRNTKSLQRICRSGGAWYKELGSSYYSIVTCRTGHSCPYHEPGLLLKSHFPDNLLAVDTPIVTFCAATA